MAKDKYIGNRVIITSYQADELGMIGTVISKSKNKIPTYFVKLDSLYVKILFLEKEFKLLDELSDKELQEYDEDQSLLENNYKNYGYDYGDHENYINYYYNNSYASYSSHIKVEKSIFKDLRSKYDKFILGDEFVGDK